MIFGSMSRHPCDMISLSILRRLLVAYDWIPVLDTPRYID